MAAVGQTAGAPGRRNRRGRTWLPTLTVAALLCAGTITAGAATAAAGPFPPGLGPALSGPAEPSAIVKPADQASTTGSTVELIVHGENLASLTAEHLPAGISAPVQISETEWRIAGEPSAVETQTVRLEANDLEKVGTSSSEFTWTISAPAPPAGRPPTATGTPAVSPAVIFSAARAVCGGPSWSPSTVATQWLLDGAPIAGATASTFVPPRIDDGHQLSCRQTAAAGGLTSSLTSLARVVHEQPAEPAWPISPAGEQCAAAVCMQEGAAPAVPGGSYPQAGAWWVAEQVRCASAPWTSAVGDSALAAVRGFAEAHTVTISLQRMTATGPVTVATQQLSDLATARDQLDGPRSPFPDAIVAAFGTQPFAAHELWTARFPGATGHADWLAAGGGLIAYALGATARSFQLTYSLSAADLGSRLRCVAGAEDGPPGAGTSASFLSPEYVVSASPRCGPRRVGPARGPQPTPVQIGDPRCLPAPSSLLAIGAGFQGVAVRGRTLALSLSCALRGGCDGTLKLASGARTLASTSLLLARGRSHLARLRLSPGSLGSMRSAGASGLAVRLTLSGHGHARPLGTLRLLAVR